MRALAARLSRQLQAWMQRSCAKAHADASDGEARLPASASQPADMSAAPLFGLATDLVVGGLDVWSFAALWSRRPRSGARGAKPAA